ncbi:MAG: hypothetical protein LBF40_04280 [Deltaproteobacteria bacterium]|jgi:hypothetical protein|nr:hypothetical protein [Deltaproteobacteria bacterium]
MKQQIIFIFVVISLSISVSTASADVSNFNLMGLKFGMKMPEIVQVLDSKYKDWEKIEYSPLPDSFYISLKNLSIEAFSIKDKNVDIAASSYGFNFILIDDFGLLAFSIIEKPEAGINRDGTLNAMTNKFGEYIGWDHGPLSGSSRYFWDFGINGEKSEKNFPCYNISNPTDLTGIPNKDECGYKISLIIIDNPMITQKSLYIIHAFDWEDFYKYDQAAQEAQQRAREKNVPDL